MAGERELRFMAAVISGLTGAIMLIVPDQFSNAAYVLIAPRIAWWGAAFLFSGLGLLAAGVLQARKWVLVALHLLVGATWLFLALGFLLDRSWVAIPAWTIFGVGIAIAPAVGREDVGSPLLATPNLMSLLGGLTATAIGFIPVAMIASKHLGNAVYATISAALLYVGIGAITTGLLLLFVTLRLPNVPDAQPAASAFGRAGRPAPAAGPALPLPAGARCTGNVSLRLCREPLAHSLRMPCGPIRCNRPFRAAQTVRSAATSPC